jgi:hypothetical protein
MTGPTRITALRYAMVVTGVIFICGIYTLARVWPSGWSWGAGHSHYWPMILGVYATLGAFLIRESRDPLASRSLIGFTIWSSVVHALIMAAMAFADPVEAGHLVGDVPALLVVAGVLGFLTRGAGTKRAATDLGVRRAA